MLRNFFFGAPEVKRNEVNVPEVEDDQPRNKFTEIQILSAHTDLVDSIQNTGPSRVVTTGQDKKGVVWDCASGEAIMELTGHTRNITCVFYFERYEDAECCLPVVVTASSDRTIRVWDVSGGTCKKVVHQHQGAVKCFCYHNKNNSGGVGVVVSGGQDICVWDSSFRLLTKLQLNSLDYIHTAISMYPQRIVVATDQPHLTVYDVFIQTCDDATTTTTTTTTSESEVKMYKTLPRHRESVLFLACIGNAMFTSASMDGAVTVWSTNTLNVIRQFNRYENFVNICDHTYPYKVNDILVADHRYVVAAIGSGFAIFDALYDKCVARVLNAHHSAVTSLTLVEDGCYLATSSLDR